MTHGEDEVARLLDPLVLRARARVGTTLHDKWRLDALLGVGGMAAVYAATHRNGSRAAVKVLHTELSINPQVRTRFLREGYVANSVGHDGAVRVLDDDAADDGSLFLVTELLDGETLEDRRLRFGGRLPEDEVLSVADQLLDLLAAAHAKGVVHRDLKPENVFLTRAGQVKVLDFGIARLRELSTVSSATKAGSSMGTPAYMPPEQARGLWDEVDAQSDLWACGATMYTLLSGQIVHDGRTTNEQLLAAMTKLAPPLGSIAPSISTAVADLVNRALAFEKAERWPNALRMQKAVRHAYHNRHGTPITTAPRLTVPETVTLSTGARASGLPTTGQPVAGVTSGASAATRARTWTARVVGGGAAAVGVAVTVALVVGTGRKTSREGSSGVASVSAPPPAGSIVSMTVDAASASSSPPEIAATDLPGAVTPAVKPSAAPRSTPLTVPPAAPQQTKSNCTTPFTIDATTGKKKWKPECF